MQPPPIIEPLRRQWNPLFWILAAVGIAVAALLCNGYLLRQFYVETAAVASGTEIRPMALVAFLGICGTVSILLGGGFAVPGIVFSLKQRRWCIALLAAVTIAMTWIPLIVSDRGFDYIVRVRQLVL